MIEIATPEPPATASSTDGPQEIIFRSRLPDITIANHLPLHAYCFEKLPAITDAPCLIDAATGKSYTFGETYRLSRKAAAALRSLGVARGDCIMLLSHNCAEFVLTFLAASFLGALTTGVNPFCTPAEIYKQLKEANAMAVVTHSSYVGKLRGEQFGEQSSFLVVTVDDAPAPEGCVAFWDAVAQADEDSLPTAEISPEDPVALPFSSGTTGLPKGVVLTHKSMVSSVAQQVDGENPNLYLQQGVDVVLCVLPLFHIFSLSSVLLNAVRAGAAVLIMPKFDMVMMLEGIQRWRVTVACVVPPLLLAMAKSADVEKYDLGSIRIVLSGAAPLGPELEDALRERLPHAVFGQGYGMTEAGPVVSMCPAFAKNPAPVKSGSGGTVVRNAELKIIDPDTGTSLSRNQPGEICIRGPQIMKGYLNDPEATAATIDAGGWLHTGDIGFVDDDDEVFIVDRVKELIKFKGFQVAPAELEALLVGHSSIVDAAVIPMKDEAAGEVPVAFVVPAGGADITEAAVKKFVAKQVVFYKRLHKVYFVESIPKSSSGKILRRELKAQLC